MADQPLVKQFVNLNLTGGINKKQDAHQLSNGQLITADNVIFGAVEGQVTKRYGCVSINPQGAPLQGGPFNALGIRDNIEPLILGANTLNRYNIERNLSTSIPTSTQGRLSVSQIVGSTGQTLDPWPPSDASTATDGQKYILVTWQEPNRLGALCYYGIQDLSSGSWIIPPKQIPILYSASGYTYKVSLRPSARYYNGNFYIFYLWNGTTSALVNASFLVYNILPLTDLANGMKAGTSSFSNFGGASAASLQNATGQFCYDVHIANGKFIVGQGPTDTSITPPFNYAYTYGTIAANGNTQNVASGTLKSINSLQTGVEGQLFYPRIAVRCDGPTTTPYAVAVGGNLVAISSANAQTSFGPLGSGGANQPTDILWDSSGNLVWLMQGTDGIASNFTILRWSISNNSFPSFTATLPVNAIVAQLLSRIFTTDNTDRYYAWIGQGGPSSDNVYTGAYLIEFDFVTRKSNVVCRTLYMENATMNQGDADTPCEVIRVPGTSRYVTFLSSALERAGNGTSFAYGALNRVEFNFAPSRGTQLLPLPTGGVLGAGAYSFYYDGNVLCEAGFSSAPTADAATSAILSSNLSALNPVVTSSSKGLAGGTSFVTASGYIEYYYLICFVRRDAYGNVYRSAPSPVITVPCPNAFNNVQFPAYNYNGGGNVMIEYYRSTQNVTGSHYFIGQVGNGKSWLDTIADGSTTPSNNTSITKNRLVYTDANELPNDPPPAIHHAAVSETRVYLIPADARNTVWFSKLFSSGRSVEFSADNVLSEGNNTALFTGVAVLDANVIVFKADQVLYFYGNGPDNTGNGSFSSFQKIATDVGCIDPASIVTIPAGILFRSRRGIELLNRSLQVSYVGAPIEPLLKTIPAFSSAVVVPKFMQVRFIPQTAGQPVLVFDYGHGRWSTFSNMSSLSAGLLNGNYWWISADGTKVYQETPDLYLDDGQPIVMTLETPEIPVGAAGTQGWGRAYRMALLGDFYSSHILSVSFAYDHQAAYTDTVQFDTSKGLISGDTVYQFRCSRLPRQVMQTLRLKITESGTLGQSCAISNIAFEVGAKNGLAKLSAQKTV